MYSNDNDQGNLISQHRYLPFGGTRQLPNQPTSGLTDYGYTGQRNLDEDLGLMDYKFRFYSPVLNRFIQPDSIVPNPVNPQMFNRFSYVGNNPINFNDPTGHISCQGANWDDGPQCVGSDEFNTKATAELQSTLKDKYGWKVGKGFKLEELNKIYQTARDIELYADELTSGGGLEWMNEYLGDINIRKNPIQGYPTNYSVPGNIILVDGWINYTDPKHWLAHELGHTWDIRSAGNPLGIGGVGDNLNKYIGGEISSTLACRFCNPGHPKNGGPVPINYYIPFGVAFSANNGYGNGATSDYLAESFAFSVYGNTASLPNESIGNWIGNQIINQTSVIVPPSNRR